MVIEQQIVCRILDVQYSCSAARWFLTIRLLHGLPALVVLDDTGGDQMTHTGGRGSGSLSKKRRKDVIAANKLFPVFRLDRTVSWSHSIWKGRNWIHLNGVERSVASHRIAFISCYRGSQAGWGSRITSGRWTAQSPIETSSARFQNHYWSMPLEVGVSDVSGAVSVATDRVDRRLNLEGMVLPLGGTGGKCSIFI